jgi:uncharacterized protein (DUF342 family)
MDNNLSGLSKQLYLSDDQQLLLLSISALKERINAVDLTQLIALSEYASFKISPAGIKEAVTSFAKLQNKTKSPPDPESIAIAKRIDAQLEISTDPTELTAKARITTAYGGQAVTLDQITQALKKLKISYGISKKNLHLLVKKAKNAKPGTLYQAVIAKGKKPVDGCDTTFERLVETPSERIMKPRKKQDGRVDMRDLGQLVTVKPGTPLMRKIPYQEGSPGMTVTGTVIKQKTGIDIKLNIGDNTELDPTDENVLIAAIAGVPQKINNGMMVDDSLIVKNVDIGFGHINYEGNVIISGDICDGMKVKATGNITVAGFIESANIECGGDLFVGKGILGRKRTSDEHPFSCEINCQGSLTAAFSQYSEMHIGKDLYIKNQLLHCMVICLGHITVHNDLKNKGVILGGLVCAYQGLTTVTLGAPAGTRTLIDLIGVYPELINRKKQLNNAILEEKATLQQVYQAKQKIAAVPASEKKQTLNTRLALIQKKTEKKLSILNRKQEENLVAVQEYINHTKVIALKELYSQVSISTGPGNILAQRSYGPTCVSIKENKLVAQPYQP